MTTEPTKRSVLKRLLPDFWDRADWLALGFLTAATIVFFSPLWLKGGWLPKGGGDLVAFMWPNFKFVSHSFHSGRLPIWNPHFNSGMPFWADNQSAVLYPFNLLVTLFTNVPYQAMELLVIFHLWLTGVLMFLCLRMLVPENRINSAPAAMGAVAWMFSDIFVLDQGHLGMVSAAAWLPLIFLLLWRALAEINWRRGLVAGGIYALCILAGHGQMAYFTTLLIGSTAIWWALWRLRDSWQDALKTLGIGALVGGVGLTLSAAGWLPVLELIQFTDRAKLGYEVASFQSAEPQSLICLVTFWQCDRPMIGYVGAITLAFALVGLVTSLRNHTKLVVLLVVIATIALMMTLGANFPVHRIAYDFLLGVANFRVPARFAMLFSFPIAILAAMGLQSLRWESVRVAAAILVTAEVVSSGIGREVQYDDPRRGFMSADIAEWLIEQPSAPEAPFRIDSASPVWHPNAALYWGGTLFDIHGYYNPLSLGHYEAYYWSVGARGTPQYNFLGAKYVIADDAPGDANFVPVYASESGAKVYLNLGAQPLVHLIYHAVPVSSFEAGWDAVHAGDWNPAVTAYIINGPALDKQKPERDTVSYRVYQPNQIVYEINTSQPAYLVMSEPDYPGWRASIDGQPTTIYQANLAFRAIYIAEPGRHTIRLVFIPTWVYMGLAISILGWVVLFVWLWHQKVQK